MIADTSVLILFARAARLDLLKTLFVRIHIPKVVHDEAIAKGPASPDVRAIAAAVGDGWIQTHDVSGEVVGRLTERFPNLGLGETACLALAFERGDPMVLFDDADARKAARVLGIGPVGCLGILARAYHDGLVRDKAAVALTLRAFLDAGLWVAADVVEHFWARLGGRD